MKKKESQSTEVKFTRRFTTDVSYEFEEITLTTVIDGDVCMKETLQKMKAAAEASRAGTETTPAEEEETEDEGNDDVDTEETTEEDDNETDDEETEEDDETEEEEEKPKAKKGKAGKTAPGSGTKGKKFKKKPQVYQRSNDTHKELFSSMMSVVAPDWKKSFESKALAKKVSQKMEGVDFLDEDGTIFPSFKETTRKAMGKLAGKAKK